MDDALQGHGVYTYEDGGVLRGTYVDGELTGPAQEFDSEGRLIFKGQYKDNIRCGVCWIYYLVPFTLFLYNPSWGKVICQCDRSITRMLYCVGSRLRGGRGQRGRRDDGKSSGLRLP